MKAFIQLYTKQGICDYGGYKPMVGEFKKNKYGLMLRKPVTFPKCTYGKNTITHFFIAIPKVKRMYFGELENNIGVSEIISPRFDAGSITMRTHINCGYLDDLEADFYLGRISKITNNI